MLTSPWIEPWFRRNEFKRALITPKDWIEPGQGKLCRSCRFLASGTVPYHDPSRPYMVTCMAVQLCKAFASGTCKGSPGLVLYQAGNETCDRYEPEIILNFVWADPPDGRGG